MRKCSFTNCVRVVAAHVLLEAPPLFQARLAIVLNVIDQFNTERFFTLRLVQMLLNDRRDDGDAFRLVTELVGEARDDLLVQIATLLRVAKATAHVRHGRAQIRSLHLQLVCYQLLLLLLQVGNVTVQIVVFL